MMEQLQVSNFYDSMYIYYLDLAVICNSAMHSGEGKDVALNFNNYAVGEYVFRMDDTNKPDPFIQVNWLSLKDIKERYNKNPYPELDDDDALEKMYPVVKAVYKKEHRGNPYTSIHYIRGKDTPVLRVSGYEECPNHIGRWNLLANEDLALGPGFDALPHVRRLQEQERTFQMLSHKLADPPVNVPAELKNNANTLPGGENYLRGDRKITPIYERQGGLKELMLAVQRTEERISKVFHNDVFLSASRDPNASPLRTGQVDRLGDESLMKLGPVVGRVFNQTVKPMVERSFNILLKKGIIPPIPPEYQESISGYNI